MKFSALPGTTAFSLDPAAHTGQCIRAPMQAEPAQVTLLGRKSTLKDFVFEVFIETTTGIADDQANHRLVVNRYFGRGQLDPAGI